jgi:potassium efflux system protein
MLKLCALLVLLCVGLAQAAPVPESDLLVSRLQALEMALKSAESSASPDKILLDALRTRLDAIKQEQARLVQAEARIQAARQLQQKGPTELAQLNRPRPAPPQPDLGQLNLDALSALLIQAQAEEQAAIQRLEAAQRAVTDTEQRAQTLRQSTQGLGAVAPALPPLPAQAPAILIEAQQILSGVHEQAIAAETLASQLEKTTLPLTLQLVQARQEVAQHELEQLRTRREHIESEINARRLSEAEQTRQQAGLGLDSQGHPLLARLIEGNKSWAERLTQTTRLLSELSTQRDEVTRRTEAIRQDMANLRQRLEQLGLGPVMGNLLLEKRRELPSEASLLRRIKENRGRLGDVQLLDLDITHARTALADRQGFIDKLMIELTPEEQANLRPNVEQLLLEREGILQRLDGIKPALLLAINDTELALESQRRHVREFTALINQNLLWMPNARPLWSTGWADYEQSLLGLFDLRRAWIELGQTLGELLTQPLLNALTLLPTLLLLGLRPQLRRRIRATLDGANAPQSESPWMTLGVLLWVLLYALPWPLLAWLLGMRLEAVALPASFALGIAQALITLAPLLLYARAALALFHPNGLAERHFGWAPHTLHALRQALRFFIFAVLPLGFLATVAIALDTEALRDGVGRLFFMLALLGLAWMFARLLHPRGEIMSTWRKTHASHWSARLAPLWFALGAGLPVLFALLAGVGYFYSAAILTQKLITSLWLALGLVIVYDLGLRILRQARLRLQERQAQTPEPYVEDEGDSSTAMDVEEISLQSLKLLKFSLSVALLAALYAVWSPILPAFHALEQIPLWDYHGEIKGETLTLSVNLWDVLVALLMLIIMVVASRNLPGLMEIVLERWTRQDVGTRYAVITITRYIIIATGLMLILGRLGVQWSQMQWLVAALGVGLGFGLQEIFANFVSGLIILFERPVRVGDMVSIGDKTGHIKRIHIRATVLEDFDRKEIIIPNKKLITEQVTNWTLSDSSTRVVVDVGVAYGSDPRKVEQILREAASRVPGLIQDPPPGVWFMGFGDSALNFRLRAFVADAEQRTDTISELHYAIEKTLRDHGISIPFPQRDIHIRDIQGLPAGLFQENKAP